MFFVECFAKRKICCWGFDRGLALWYESLCFKTDYMEWEKSSEVLGKSNLPSGMKKGEDHLNVGMYHIFFFGCIVHYNLRSWRYDFKIREWTLYILFSGSKHRFDIQINQFCFALFTNLFLIPKGAMKVKNQHARNLSSRSILRVAVICLSLRIYDKISWILPKFRTVRWWFGEEGRTSQIRRLPFILRA